MSNIKTILIVDDSKVSRMMIKAIVKDNQPDWSVLEAANADEAFVIDKDNQIDFFSIDLNMPGIDGLEFISSLKDSHKTTKFALLTANTQEHIHNRANELGIKCINKPITENSIGEMLSYFNG